MTVYRCTECPDRWVDPGFQPAGHHCHQTARNGTPDGEAAAVVECVFVAPRKAWRQKFHTRGCEIVERHGPDYFEARDPDRLGEQWAQCERCAGAERECPVCDQPVDEVATHVKAAHSGGDD
jgi:hypothetical protein